MQYNNNGEIGLRHKEISKNTLKMTVCRTIGYLVNIVEIRIRVNDDNKMYTIDKGFSYKLSLYIKA